MAIPFANVGFPDLYERELVGPLFLPFARSLVDDADVRTGDSVLDVACGTGCVARVVKERTPDSTVVGVDLNPAMLDVARRVRGDIDWRQGNAASLPLADGEAFDVVLCQQGLQFFPDRPAAVRELRRALSPGGRLALSTWRPDSLHPVLYQLRAMAERRLGAVEDRRHAFGEPEPVAELLRDAGFEAVATRTETRSITYPDGSVFVRLNAMALAGMSAAGAEMSEDEKQRVADALVQDAEDLVKSNTGPSGFSYEISATVATARG